jgi:hypothetical protein
VGIKNGMNESEKKAGERGKIRGEGRAKKEKKRSNSGVDGARAQLYTGVQPRNVEMSVFSGYRASDEMLVLDREIRSSAAFLGR